MRFPLRLFIASAALAMLATTATAAWYDDYEDGLAAAKKGNWTTVIQKMNAALAQQPKENRKLKTYGAIFIAYHPYYYRGAANYNLGRYQEAIADLERTTGVGPVDLGSVDSLTMKAQSKLQAAQPVVPQPVQPQPAQPVPNPPVQQPTRTEPLPAPPSVDPALAQSRTAAERLLGQATARMTAAQREQAETLAPQEFDQARKLLTQAQSRSISASSAGDWRAVGDLADRASRAFGVSISRAQMQVAREGTASSRAADAVLEPVRQQVRKALELYFRGDFKNAAREFERLSREQGSNAMIWAFLGASQYYNYYLDGEEDSTKKTAAETAFRRARRLRPSLTLSSRYFSPRVRRFFAGVR